MRGDPMSRRVSGPVERATRRDLREWGANGALAESALTLARALDDGAGLATAAVARELRATLAQLMPVQEDHDDLAELVAGLSSPVRDATAT